jgi:hypothetical protein
MTPELRAVVERGYEVFGFYATAMEKAKSLCVCRCPSCMSEQCERDLLTTPIPQSLPRSAIFCRDTSN